MKDLSLASARQILQDEAIRVAAQLEAFNLKLVLAESCSGGMAAAALTGIPGISENFCGSLVTYRTETKKKWLVLSPRLLSKDDAVTEKVAIEMAIRALTFTPESDLAAAITGHLGPNAPKHLDGVSYCAVALRSSDGGDLAVFTSTNTIAAPRGFEALELRQWRQLAASHSLLMMVRSLLEDLETEMAAEGSTLKVATQKGDKKDGKHRSKSKPRPRAKK